MKDLSTFIILDYTSKALEDVIDKEFHKKKELINLSNTVCKTLELTDNPCVFVGKQDEDALLFKVKEVK